MENVQRTNVCRLPISSAANDANEKGIPLSLSRPTMAATELDALAHLARAVSKELFRLPFKPENSTGSVSFEGSDERFELTSIQLSLDGDEFSLRVFSEKGALQKRFNPKELRNRDPKSGMLLVGTNEDEEAKSTKAKRSIVEIHHTGARKDNARDFPDKVEKKGKVGYEVTWSDGAKYIYSKRAIAMAAHGTIHQ